MHRHPLTRLRLERELGRGAMGHPAIDRNLLRHIALKRLVKEHADSQFAGAIAQVQPGQSRGWGR